MGTIVLLPCQGAVAYSKCQRSHSPHCRPALGDCPSHSWVAPAIGGSSDSSSDSAAHSIRNAESLGALEVVLSKIPHDSLRPPILPGKPGSATSLDDMKQATWNYVYPTSPGLLNPDGFSCFANAALQLLFAVPGIMDHLSDDGCEFKNLQVGLRQQMNFETSDDASRAWAMLQQAGPLFKAAATCSSRVIDPHHFIDTVPMPLQVAGANVTAGTRSGRRRPAAHSSAPVQSWCSDQQDALEFLSALLTSVVAPLADEHQLMSLLQTHTCTCYLGSSYSGEVSMDKSVFFKLQLDTCSPSDITQSLLHTLDAHFAPQALPIYETPAGAVSVTWPHLWGKVVIFTMYRWTRLSSRGVQRRNTRKVSFPQTLMLNDSTGTVTYRLVSVLSHRAVSGGGNQGHWYAHSWDDHTKSYTMFSDADRCRDISFATMAKTEEGNVGALCYLEYDRRSAEQSSTCNIQDTANLAALALLKDVKEQAAQHHLAAEQGLRHLHVRESATPLKEGILSATEAWRSRCSVQSLVQQAAACGIAAAVTALEHGARKSSAAQLATRVHLAIMQSLGVDTAYTDRARKGMLKAISVLQPQPHPSTVSAEGAMLDQHSAFQQPMRALAIGEASKANVATVGCGVFVKESHIPGAGEGLFASRSFDKQQLVTEYEGVPLPDRFAAAHCEDQRHILAVNPTRQAHRRGDAQELGNKIYIKGFQCTKPGDGGGSKCNHSFHGNNNTEFVSVDGRVYLRATRDILLGEEILVDCGSGGPDALGVMMGTKRYRMWTYEGHHHVEVVYVNSYAHINEVDNDAIVVGSRQSRRHTTPIADVVAVINKIHDVKLMTIPVEWLLVDPYMSLPVAILRAIVKHPLKMSRMPTIECDDLYATFASGLLPNEQACSEHYAGGRGHSHHDAHMERLKQQFANKSLRAIAQEIAVQFHGMCYCPHTSGEPLTELTNFNAYVSAVCEKLKQFCGFGLYTAGVIARTATWCQKPCVPGSHVLLSHISLIFPGTTQGTYVKRLIAEHGDVPCQHLFPHVPHWMLSLCFCVLGPIPLRLLGGASLPTLRQCIDEYEKKHEIQAPMSSYKSWLFKINGKSSPSDSTHNSPLDVQKCQDDAVPIDETHLIHLHGLPSRGQKLLIQAMLKDAECQTELSARVLSLVKAVHAYEVAAAQEQHVRRKMSLHMKDADSLAAYNPAPTVSQSASAPLPTTGDEQQLGSGAMQRLMQRWDPDAPPLICSVLFGASQWGTPIGSEHNEVDGQLRRCVFDQGKGQDDVVTALNHLRLGGVLPPPTPQPTADSYGNDQSAVPLHAQKHALKQQEVLKKKSFCPLVVMERNRKVARQQLAQLQANIAAGLVHEDVILHDINLSPAAVSAPPPPPTVIPFETPWSSPQFALYLRGMPGGVHGKCILEVFCHPATGGLISIIYKPGLNSMMTSVPVNMLPVWPLDEVVETGWNAFTEAKDTAKRDQQGREPRVPTRSRHRRSELAKVHWSLQRWSHNPVTNEWEEYRQYLVCGSSGQGVSAMYIGPAVCINGETLLNVYYDTRREVHLRLMGHTKEEQDRLINLEYSYKLFNLGFFEKKPIPRDWVKRPYEPTRAKNAPIEPNTSAAPQQLYRVQDAWCSTSLLSNLRSMSRQQLYELCRDTLSLPPATAELAHAEDNTPCLTAIHNVVSEMLRKWGTLESCDISRESRAFSVATAPRHRDPYSFWLAWRKFRALTTGGKCIPTLGISTKTVSQVRWSPPKVHPQLEIMQLPDGGTSAAFDRLRMQFTNGCSHQNEGNFNSLFRTTIAATRHQFAASDPPQLIGCLSVTCPPHLLEPDEVKPREATPPDILWQEKYLQHIWTHMKFGSKLPTMMLVLLSTKENATLFTHGHGPYNNKRDLYWLQTLLGVSPTKLFSDVVASDVSGVFDIDMILATDKRLFGEHDGTGRGLNAYKSPAAVFAIFVLLHLLAVDYSQHAHDNLVLMASTPLGANGDGKLLDETENCSQCRYGAASKFAIGLGCSTFGSPRLVFFAPSTRPEHNTAVPTGVPTAAEHPTITQFEGPNGMNQYIPQSKLLRTMIGSSSLFRTAGKQITSAGLTASTKLNICKGLSVPHAILILREHIYYLRRKRGTAMQKLLVAACELRDVYMLVLLAPWQNGQAIHTQTAQLCAGSFKLSVHDFKTAKGKLQLKQQQYDGQHSGWQDTYVKDKKNNINVDVAQLHRTFGRLVEHHETATTRHYLCMYAVVVLTSLPCETPERAMEMKGAGYGNYSWTGRNEQKEAADMASVRGQSAIDPRHGPEADRPDMLRARILRMLRHFKARSLGRSILHDGKARKAAGQWNVDIKRVQVCRRWQAAYKRVAKGLLPDVYRGGAATMRQISVVDCKEQEKCTPEEGRAMQIWLQDFANDVLGDANRGLDGTVPWVMTDDEKQHLQGVAADMEKFVTFEIFATEMAHLYKDLQSLQMGVCSSILNKTSYPFKAISTMCCSKGIVHMRSVTGEHKHAIIGPCRYPLTSETLQWSCGVCSVILQDRPAIGKHLSEGDCHKPPAKGPRHKRGKKKRMNGGEAQGDLVCHDAAPGTGRKRIRSADPIVRELHHNVDGNELMEPTEATQMVVPDNACSLHLSRVALADGNLDAQDMLPLEYRDDEQSGDSSDDEIGPESEDDDPSEDDDDPSVVYGAGDEQRSGATKQPPHDKADGHLRRKAHEDQATAHILKRRSEEADLGMAHATENVGKALTHGGGQFTHASVGRERSALVLLGFCDHQESDKIRVTQLKAMGYGHITTVARMAAEENGYIHKTNWWVHVELDFGSQRGVLKLLATIKELKGQWDHIHIHLDFYGLQAGYYDSAYGTHWLSTARRCIAAGADSVWLPNDLHGEVAGMIGSMQDTRGWKHMQALGSDLYIASILGNADVARRGCVGNQEITVHGQMSRLHHPHAFVVLTSANNAAPSLQQHPFLGGSDQPGGAMRLALNSSFHDDEAHADIDSRMQMALSESSLQAGMLVAWWWKGDVWHLVHAVVFVVDCADLWLSMVICGFVCLYVVLFGYNLRLPVVISGHLWIVVASCGYLLSVVVWGYLAMRLSFVMCG